MHIATINQENISQEHIRAENSTHVVWQLAWPAVALQTIQVLNGFVSTFLVGRLESASTTAQSAAESVTLLIFATAMAFHISATALVSRAFGAGNAQELRKSASEVARLSIFGGLILLGMALLVLPSFAEFIIPKGNHIAKNHLIQYLTYYLMGMPAMFLIEGLAGALQGTGDTKSPLVLSGLQIVLNVVFNVILVLPVTHIGNFISIPGAGLGIIGVGISYALSSWVAAIIYLIRMRKTVFHHCMKLALPSFAWSLRILKIGGPATMTWLFRTFMLMGLMKILGTLANGSEAIAALKVGFVVENIAILHAFGLGVAASSLAGQSLGMLNPFRAKRLGWIAAHHGAVVTAIFSALIFVFAEQISELLMPNKPLVIGYAAEYIRYTCITEVLFAYSIVLKGSMNGAGDASRPMWLTTISMCMIRIPLAWALVNVFEMGTQGCWLAMTTTQGLLGVLLIVSFMRGQWLRTKI